MRVVDRRFETGEIFIKWDDTAEDDWLILIYIKDNSPDQGIVIEDKSNPEKHNSYEFQHFTLKVLSLGHKYYRHILIYKF